MEGKRKIQPRTFPGSLTVQNHGSLTWGWQAVAYGCQNQVVVVDSESAQIVQVLDGHTAAVTKVAWQPRPSPPVPAKSTKDGGPQAVRLVSGDLSGHLIIWDVHSGASRLEFGETGSGKMLKSWVKPVADLAWLPSEIAGKAGFVLALHAPSPLVLWDADSGAALWKVDFGEKLTSFALDPFVPHRLVVLTDVALLIVNDFSTTEAPKQLNNKYQVTAAANPGSPDSDGGKLLSAVFSPHDEEQLFLVFSREVLIMDLEIHQTIGSIVLEKGSAAFKAICPCARNPAVYFLHSNGLVSYRCRSKDLNSHYSFGGQSEALRLGKNSHVQALALNPRNESQTVAVTSAGWVLLHELSNMPSKVAEQLPVTVNDITADKERLILMRSIAAISPITCMEMCPGDVHDNGRRTIPLLAAGTSSGAVQVINLETGELERQFLAHVCAVQMVDWCGCNKIVSFSTEEAGANFHRNTVSILTLSNGRVYKLRAQASEPTPLQSVKCSPLGQYIVVLLKGKPLELWDAQSRTILKTMPHTFPAVAGLEWSFTTPKPRPKEGTKSADSSGGPWLPPSPHHHVLAEKTSYIKEHLIVATPDGHACHFTVEGSVVRNGMRLTAESTLAHTTCIAWKGDHIVMGDSNGNLIFWNSKTKGCRAIPSSHSAIKAIRFSPGRSSRCMSVAADGTGKLSICVTHVVGVATWDAAASDLLTQRKVKTSKSKPENFIAAVWSSPDRPVVATKDGVLRIYDVWLQICVSPLATSVFTRPVQASYMASVSVAEHVKNMLRHQPHRKAYTLPTVDDLIPVSADNPLVGQDLFEQQVVRFITNMPDNVRKGLLEAPSAVERCLITATYFGDKFKVLLWTMVAQYMAWEDAPWPDLSSTSSSQSTRVDVRASKAADPATDPTAPAEAKADNTQPPYTLSAHFGILSDQSAVRSSQLARLSLHQSRQLSYDLLRDSTERHVLLGQHQSAVQMLLETDTRHENFYADSLRACVIAAVSSPTDCQNTIKLVAMNLIASGKLMEGVELLCLIGNGLDACRYLQTYNEWNKAAKLAKSTLQPAETAEVLLRWADHLAGGHVLQREQAVLVLLSFGQARRAASLLHELGHLAEAAILLELVDDAEPASPRTPSSGMLSAGPSVVETVFTSFAKLLKSQCHYGAAKYYCEERAGIPLHQL